MNKRRERQLYVIRKATEIMWDLIHLGNVCSREDADSTMKDLLSAIRMIKLDAPNANDFSFDGIECCYIENGTIFHWLEEMPFARHEDGKGWINPTGREWYSLIDGSWVIEWEGDEKESEW